MISDLNHHENAVMKRDFLELVSVRIVLDGFYDGYLTKSS